MSDRMDLSDEAMRWRMSGEGCNTPCGLGVCLHGCRRKRGRAVPVEFPRRYPVSFPPMVPMPSSIERRLAPRDIERIAQRVADLLRNKP